MGLTPLGRRKDVAPDTQKKRNLFKMSKKYIS